MISEDRAEDGALVARACADLRREGRAGEAVNILRMWLLSHPQDRAAEYQLALALLSLGAFSEAWTHFEARLTIEPPPRIPYPFWLGQPVLGRYILVVGERRLEDQRAFLPFVEALSERGGLVTFICDAALLTTLGETAYSALPMGEEVTFPDPGFWTPQALIGQRLGLTDRRIAAWARTAP